MINVTYYRPEKTRPDQTTSIDQKFPATPGTWITLYYELYRQNFGNSLI